MFRIITNYDAMRIKTKYVASMHYDMQHTMCIYIYISLKSEVLLGSIFSKGLIISSRIFKSNFLSFREAAALNFFKNNILCRRQIIKVLTIIYVSIIQ